MLRTVSRPKLLVLARHGESIVNALKDGQTFCPTPEVAATLRKIPTHLAPLTDRGREQATILGEQLYSNFRTFDVIVYSGYERTRETLVGVVNQLESGKPVPEILIDFRLRERESGYGYSMTKEEFDRHFPYVQEYWKKTGWFYAVPPGGESCAQMWQRGIPAIESIFEQYADKSVLIVGHGRFFQTLQTFLDGKWPGGFSTLKCPVRHLHNCEYLTYRF